MSSLSTLSPCKTLKGNQGFLFLVIHGLHFAGAAFKGTADDFHFIPCCKVSLNRSAVMSQPPENGVDFFLAHRERFGTLAG